MVLAADLIVVATVANVSDGRLVGDEEPQLQMLEVTLAVEEVLKGDEGLVQNTVLLESEKVGAPFTLEWRSAGQRILAILWSKRDPESMGRFFRALNSESVYLLENDDLVATIDSDFASQVARLSPPEIRRVIREATASG